MGTIPAYFAWAVLALIGLDALLAAWLLRRDPALGKPRCRACWYDMAGAKGTRCPECGTEHPSPRDLLRRRLRWGRSALALLPLPILLLLAVRLGALGTLYYAVMPKWQGVGSRQVSGHTITHYRARNPAIPEERVVVRGRVNYEMVDRRVWAGVAVGSAPRSTTTQPLLGDGSLDCTGDGEPDLIIEGFSGGAHCCTTYAVLQLGAGRACECRGEPLSRPNSSGRHLRADALFCHSCREKCRGHVGGGSTPQGRSVFCSDGFKGFRSPHRWAPAGGIQNAARARVGACETR